MIRDTFVRTSLLLVSLAGCSSTAPANDEIARESAETNAVIEAAKNHPALKGNSAEAFGKPLPPLPGVSKPDQKVPSKDDHKPHQH